MWGLHRRGGIQSLPSLLTQMLISPINTVTDPAETVFYPIAFWYPNQYIYDITLYLHLWNIMEEGKEKIIMSRGHLLRESIFCIWQGSMIHEVLRSCLNKFCTTCQANLDGGNLPRLRWRVTENWWLLREENSVFFRDESSHRLSNTKWSVLTHIHARTLSRLCLYIHV